ncbi:MAG: hypothetical protein HQ596_08360 [Candidatus Saganbacteria bacterium]|nr:hypothetical protein [Candidatus Saganbacteria bacterium]
MYAYCSSGPLPQVQAAPLESDLWLAYLADLRLYKTTAQQNGIFQSQAWQNFQEAIATLSTQELAVFGSIDRFGGSRLHEHLTLLRTSAHDDWMLDLVLASGDFKNLRDVFELRAFVNIVTKDGLADPALAQKYVETTPLFRAITTFKRLSAYTDPTSGPYVQYKPRYNLYVNSHNWLATISSKRDYDFGKWVVITDSHDNAARIAESLLPCFARDKLFSLKIDVVPLANRYWRVVVYAPDHDTATAKILGELTDKELIWVYERECKEAAALDLSLDEFRLATIAEASNPTLDIDGLDPLSQLESKRLRDELGLTDYQHDLLRKALSLEQHGDMTDSATMLAHTLAYDSQSNRLLLAVALKPSNRKRFGDTLKKHTIERMSIFR